jgi:methylase of polypeptide subunit release factors
VEFYGCLIGEAERLLRPGGWLVMELGIRQLDTVRQMFSTKWTETHVKSDLAGLPRVLAGRLKD